MGIGIKKKNSSQYQKNGLYAFCTHLMKSCNKLYVMNGWKFESLFTENLNFRIMWIVPLKRESGLFLTHLYAISIIVKKMIVMICCQNHVKNLVPILWFYDCLFQVDLSTCLFFCFLFSPVPHAGRRVSGTQMTLLVLRWVLFLSKPPSTNRAKK